MARVVGKAARGHEELPVSLAKDGFGVPLLYSLSSHPKASSSMPARWQSQTPCSPKSPVANVQNKEAVFGVSAVPAGIWVPVTLSSHREKADVALVMGV